MTQASANMHGIKRIEEIALSKWLFLFVLAILLLPPYVSSGFEISRIPSINAAILMHAIKPDFAIIFPAFNILALISLVAVYILRQQSVRIFAIYAALTYLLAAVLQNMSVSTQYGLGIASTSFSLTLLTAAAWLWEAIFIQNDFSRRPPICRLAILLPVSLLALWGPINEVDLLPDFHLIHFKLSGTSLTFCMMTTVFLAVLLAYFPGVNPVTLRITSLTGLLIGIGNLWLEFVYLPEMWWVGVLHIPLVVLSALGLFLSIKH
jgi:hypothetical protein